MNTENTNKLISQFPILYNKNFLFGYKDKADIWLTTSIRVKFQ